MAPLHSSIRPPSAVKRSPPLSTSTPAARLPSKRILRAVTLAFMVRFNRWRAMFR